MVWSFLFRPRRLEERRQVARLLLGREAWPPPHLRPAYLLRPSAAPAWLPPSPAPRASRPRLQRPEPHPERRPLPRLHLEHPLHRACRQTDHPWRPWPWDRLLEEAWKRRQDCSRPDSPEAERSRREGPRPRAASRSTPRRWPSSPWPSPWRASDGARETGWRTFEAVPASPQSSHPQRRCYPAT